jgi:hypothetical protein
MGESAGADASIPTLARNPNASPSLELFIRNTDVVRQGE